MGHGDQAHQSCSVADVPLGDTGYHPRLGNRERCPQLGARGLLSQVGVSPHSAQGSHFSPRHKGTWKSSGLLSATIITTKTGHSRASLQEEDICWSQKHLAKDEDLPATKMSSGSQGELGCHVQVKCHLDPGPTWPRGSVLEVILTQKHPSENQRLGVHPGPLGRGKPPPAFPGRLSFLL